MTYTPSPNWQYPANPKDGDFIVRGNLKATYDEASKTWIVGEIPTIAGVPGPEGPQGPRGEKGDPGQGVNITAAVPGVIDLPQPPQAEDQFWIVDSTNTLYYSDGIQWYELGSPIQGPQGEDGADGSDGSDGVNGAPGKGWTGTTVIDQRPSNYQVTFNSNDGLEFTTDNIMGPQGESGSLAVATRTSIGGIKIGRGLTIFPDGTLAAGETFVDLETVPLTPEGTVYNYSLAFKAFFHQFGTVKTENFRFISVDEPGGYPNAIWATDEKTFQMPLTANAALVYFFNSTTQRLNQSYVGSGLVAVRAKIDTRLELTNATFDSGITDNLMSVSSFHNLAYNWTSTARADRTSILPYTKINQINFQPGSEVTFKFSQRLTKVGQSEITGGVGRVIIIPIRDTDDGGNTNPEGPGNPGDGPEGFGIRDYGDVQFTNSANIQALDDFLDDGTTSTDLAADFLKNTIASTIATIDDNLHYGTEAEKAQLIEYRDQLFDARNQPGSAEELLDNYVQPIVDGVIAITDYSFRFETP